MRAVSTTVRAPRPQTPSRWTDFEGARQREVHSERETFEGTEDIPRGWTGTSVPGFAIVSCLCIPKIYASEPEKCPPCFTIPGVGTCLCPLLHCQKLVPQHHSPAAGVLRPAVVLGPLQPPGCRERGSFGGGVLGLCCPHQCKDEHKGDTDRLSVLCHPPVQVG